MATKTDVNLKVLVTLADGSKLAMKNASAGLDDILVKLKSLDRTSLGVVSTELNKITGSTQQASNAAKNLGSNINAGFEKAGGAAKRATRNVGGFRAAMDDVEAATGKSSTHMVSDFTKAEGAWLAFDRAFRLGIDRDMMTMLTTFPKLTKALAFIGGSPMGILSVIALKYVADGVEKLVKVTEEAEHAAEKATVAYQKLNESIEQSTHQLTTRMDNANASVDKLLNPGAEAGDNLRLAFDKAVAGADELQKKMEQLSDQRQKVFSDKSLQIGQWAAFFTGQASTEDLTGKKGLLTEGEKSIANSVQSYNNLLKGVELSGNADMVRKYRLQGLQTVIQSITNEIDKQNDAWNRMHKAQAKFDSTNAFQHQLEFGLRDYTAELTLAGNNVQALTAALENLKAMEQALQAEEKAAAEQKAEEARQRASEALKIRDDASIEVLNKQLSDLKTKNQAIEQEEKTFFDASTMGIKDYFQNRATRMEAEFILEQKLADAHIKELRDKLKFARPGNERNEIRNEIQKAQDDKNTALGQHDNAINALWIQYGDQLQQITTELRNVEDEADKFYKGSLGSLDQINHKYDDLLKKMKQVGGSAAEVERARQAAITQFQMQVIDRNTKRDADAFSEQAAEEKTRLGSIKGAALTPEQLANITNDILAKQQEAVQRQLEGVAQKMELLRGQRDSLLASGASQQDVSGLDEQLSDLALTSEKLRNSMEELRNQTVQVGDAFKKDFQGDLKTMLDNLTTGHPQRALADFPLSFERQITGAYTSEVSTAITGWLDKTMTTKNGGLFNTLAKGLSESMPLGSQNNPSYTYVMNLPSGSGNMSSPFFPLPAGISGGSFAPDLSSMFNAQAQSVSSLFPGLGAFSNLSTDTGLFKAFTSLFGGSALGGSADPLGLNAPGVMDLSGLMPSLSSLFHADGGLIHGPGTGTSDSIPARLSNHEFVVKSKQAKKWLPLLTMVNNGSLDHLQSIATPSRVASPGFAEGGLVGGEGTPVHVGGASGPILVQVHPDAMHMTLSDWLQGEIARQYYAR